MDLVVHSDRKPALAGALPRPLFRFDQEAFDLASPGAAARPDEVIVGWTRLLRR